jgi:phosphoribosylamine--glycine ligase
MNILVVGSGGREHALCWAIARSPLCTSLYCTPGNAGIAQVATCLDVGAEDIEGIIDIVNHHDIGLVVIGPEAPLVAGLADAVTADGVKAFGPSRAAAILEGSKGFMKDLCAKYDIPTAAYGRFRDVIDAKDFIARTGAPIVVKADGLAAGKGVVVATTVSEANAAVEDILGGKFGKAGAELVIEEFLAGEEASLFALTDGKNVLALAGAQDHKRVFDGDEGPNTGGMGAYSPAPVLDDAMTARVMDEIIRPTVAAMNAEGRPFKGVLYAGLMITADGPKLIEYNVRFGDPETQPLMMRLDSDLVPALLACADGTLDTVALRWKDEAALCVVMAADGYPGAYEKGSVIKGLEKTGAMDGVTVFHAGTATKGGETVATGGRVLGVTALGRDVAEAQKKAYAAVDVIDWPGGFCRRDIGWRAIGR